MIQHVIYHDLWMIMDDLYYCMILQYTVYFFCVFVCFCLSGRLLPNALVLLGPPCSLFVFLSSSLHKRSPLLSEGDITRYAVRMANAIIRNTVTCQEKMLLYAVVGYGQLWPVMANLYSLSEP